ncbi:MAG TPA: hypothetical protein VFZ91_12870 [Allosphingosinicella sp.]
MSISISLALTACAISKPTHTIILDYNKTFARTRNEMLLVNVLRAAAREPLQFSTMGTVTGGVANSGSLKLPFTSLLGPGASVISPELTINDSVNPTVNITPLGNKEFAAGILSPMRTETVRLFLHNGWDAHFLLPVIVGGVYCADTREVLLNSGEYLDNDGNVTKSHQAFVDFFHSFATSFDVGEPAIQTLKIADEKALEPLKAGLGPNLIIRSVQKHSDGHHLLTIEDHSRSGIQGDEKSLQDLCTKQVEAKGRVKVPSGRYIPGALSFVDSTKAAGHPPHSAAARDGNRIILRSVSSIIQYLGESHRVRYQHRGKSPPVLTYFNQETKPKTLFKIDWWLRRGDQAAQVKFQETFFYIPRIDLRNPDDDDRTLKTLSFLDQLIALQTSEASVRGAQPIIAITQP